MQICAAAKVVWREAASVVLHPLIKVATVVVPVTSQILKNSVSEAINDHPTLRDQSLLETNRSLRNALAQCVRDSQATIQVSQHLIQRCRSKQFHRQRKIIVLKKGYQHLEAELAVIQEELDTLRPRTNIELYRATVLRGLVQKANGKLAAVAQEIARIKPD